MRRLPCGRVALLLTGLVLSGLPSAGYTEPPKAQPAIFETFDKAAIKGTWYPSSADGVKSPVVMLLHKIGGNRQQEGWDSLAQGLQEKGFAVLSFDFRGHGESRNVRAQEFWQYPTNKGGILARARGKDSIDQKDFLLGYYPYLANDIAAAKLYLELKNNAKECNASETYVVGAEDGASLGLLWMGTEFLRHKRSMGPLGQPVMFPDPEGKDLSALVCLSIRNSFGGPKGAALPTNSLFKEPIATRLRGVPMCFFYGEEDDAGKKCANYIYDKGLSADRKNLKLTFKIGQPQTKLAGNDLVANKALSTRDDVVRYMAEKIKDAKVPRPWSDRDVPVDGRPTLNALSEVQVGAFGITLPK